MNPFKMYKEYKLMKDREKYLKRLACHLLVWKDQDVKAGKVGQEIINILEDSKQ